MKKNLLSGFNAMCLQKDLKKRFGFSLIELLISLIVISVIIAAFTPIITAKLKHREVALSGSKIGKKCSEKFGENCAYCSDTQCSLCLNFLSCASNQYIDIADNCTCKNCSKFANCASCTKDYCTGCKEGYGYNSTNHTCSICNAPYVSDGGKSGCRKCENGYEYQNENGKRYCKTCDTANGWFPNGDRKGCYQVKCSKGQYRNGTSCLSCDAGYYQSNDNFTGASCSYCGGAQQYSSSKAANCSTCPEGQKANSNHTGCDTVTCASGQYRSGINCYPCNGPCATCSGSGTYCTSCIGGYQLSGSNCTLISVTPPEPTTPSCAENQYLSGNSCVTCPEHCTSCTSASNCTGCETDYKVSSGKCTYDPCYKWNAVYIKETVTYKLDNKSRTTTEEFCMKKYNAGDSGGPSLPSGINFAVTSTGSNKVCWQNTSGTFTNPSGYTYPTQPRTVCNWNAGKAICAAITDGGKTWSLPTKAQGTAVVDYINKYQKDLQLCNRGTDNGIWPYCQSENNACKGSTNNDHVCAYAGVFTQQLNDDGAPLSIFLENGVAALTNASGNSLKGGSRSIRCVTSL